MANTLDVRIVEDGRRNAVVKIVGVADTSSIVQTPAIQLSQFKNNDTDRVTFNGLRLVDADFSVSGALAVLLEWNGNTKQSMCALTGTGQIKGRRDGGYVPDRTVSGYDGNVNLTTKGFVPGNVYVFNIILRMTKMYS